MNQTPKESRKLLWPTDFSKNAAAALPYVRSLSVRYSLEIHILYVIEDLVHHEPWYGEFDQSHAEKLQAWEKEKASEHLAHICQSYLEGCPLYIRHVRVGDVVTEILSLVDQEGIDMIVMATKGRKSGAHHFGGTSDQVMRNATIPVVLIPVAE